MSATRRQLLLAAAAAATAPAAAVPGRSWLDTLATRVGALGGPGLLLSYDVAPGDAFGRSHGNCAYVYDNAATGLALIAGGHIAAARRLGDALLAAQSRDRFWTDGRLRNAYAAGPSPPAGTYPLPGWWDPAQNKWLEDAYQAGTATGVTAWAMLFWLALSRAAGDARYREAAARAGDWVQRAVVVPAGFSGGFLGWEPSPTRLGWVSTEHNLDLSVAFAALGSHAAAAHATAFVARMFNPREGRFNAGLNPAGGLNPHAAADANLWPLLAPAARPEWAAALGWVLSHQGVPPQRPDGIDFDDDRDGIWLEGTAYTAITARRAALSDVADRMMAALRAQTAPSGLVWACTVPRLSTGFSTGLTDDADFFYFRHPHLGATAWAALAAMNANPFSLPG